MLVAFDVIYVKEPFLTYYVNLVKHQHGGLFSAFLVCTCFVVDVCVELINNFSDNIDSEVVLRML